jgi:hypothetical protein
VNDDDPEELPPIWVSIAALGLAGVLISADLCWSPGLVVSAAMTNKFIGEAAHLFGPIPGSLEERMVEYLAAMVGLQEDEMDGPYPLKQRVELGVIMEFGPRARVSFHEPRLVRLVCGNVTAEIRLSPGSVS